MGITVAGIPVVAVVALVAVASVVAIPTPDGASSQRTPFKVLDELEFLKLVNREDHTQEELSPRQVLPENVDKQSSDYVQERLKANIENKTRSKYENVNFITVNKAADYTTRVFSDDLHKTDSSKHTKVIRTPTAHNSFPVGLQAVTDSSNDNALKINTADGLGRLRPKFGAKTKPQSQNFGSSAGFLRQSLKSADNYAGEDIHFNNGGSGSTNVVTLTKGRSRPKRVHQKPYGIPHTEQTRYLNSKKTQKFDVYFDTNDYKSNYPQRIKQEFVDVTDSSNVIESEGTGMIEYFDEWPLLEREQPLDTVSIKNNLNKYYDTSQNFGKFLVTPDFNLEKNTYVKDDFDSHSVEYFSYYPDIQESSIAREKTGKASDLSKLEKKKHRVEAILYDAVFRNQNSFPSTQEISRQYAIKRSPINVIEDMNKATKTAKLKGRANKLPTISFAPPTSYSGSAPLEEAVRIVRADTPEYKPLEAEALSDYTKTRAHKGLGVPMIVSYDARYPNFYHNPLVERTKYDFRTIPKKMFGSFHKMFSNYIYKPVSKYASHLYNTYKPGTFLTHQEAFHPGYHHMPAYHNNINYLGLHSASNDPNGFGHPGKTVPKILQTDDPNKHKKSKKNLDVGPLVAHLTPEYLLEDERKLNGVYVYSNQGLVKLNYNDFEHPDQSSYRSLEVPSGLKSRLPLEPPPIVIKNIPIKNFDDYEVLSDSASEEYQETPVPAEIEAGPTTLPKLLSDSQIIDEHESAFDLKSIYEPESAILHHRNIDEELASAPRSVIAHQSVVKVRKAVPIFSTFYKETKISPTSVGKSHVQPETIQRSFASEKNLQESSGNNITKPKNAVKTFLEDHVKENLFNKSGEHLKTETIEDKVEEKEKPVQAPRKNIKETRKIFRTSLKDILRKTSHKNYIEKPRTVTTQRTVETREQTTRTPRKNVRKAQKMSRKSLKDFLKQRKVNKPVEIIKESSTHVTQPKIVIATVEDFQGNVVRKLPTSQPRQQNTKTKRITDSRVKYYIPPTTEKTSPPFIVVGTPQVFSRRMSKEIS